jgi:hypothetical protein
MSSYNSPFGGDVIQPTDVAYASYALNSTTGTIQLEWPLNGNATDYVAARVMQVSTTSTAYELWMPPANQASVGQDALIYNTGTVKLNIKSYGGLTSICTVDTSSSGNGSAQYIFITANANTSGTWGVIAFGSSTTAASAVSLAGAGLTPISTTLNAAYPAAAVSTGITFSSADRAVANYWAGGTGSATLPSAASLGNNWFMLFRNNGTGTYTINCTGADQIDGASNKQFNPDESAIIVCSGSRFFTVGYGQSSNFFFNILVKTVTNGAYSLTSSQCANIIQEYVGNLTGNVTVTYPPIVNLYVISNQTTPNGYTLTVTTGISGGTTATIPASAQATLVCDGTNFFNANTVQSGGTSFSIVDGTVSGPAIYFGSEPTTGIYHPGSGEFGVSVLGTKRLDVTTTGIAVTGSGTFSGAVSGTTGTFTSGVSGGTFP